MEHLTPQKVVVMASGRGSNFEALLMAEKKGLIAPFTIIGLVCNQPLAGARALAKKHGVPDFLVNSNDFKSTQGFDRIAYEKELLQCLVKLKPDWIFLAGYLLVLGSPIIRAFPQRILNIHPSLLPKHRGLRAQKQSIEAGDSVTGCTVHWVTEELDEGPILLQKEIQMMPGETEDSLSERLLPLEHQTYIEALQKLAKQWI